MVINFETELLHDIGFDLYQLAELRAMHRRNILNPVARKPFEIMIADVKDSLKRNRIKYLENYGKNAEIVDIKRVFLTYRRNPE